MKAICTACARPTDAFLCDRCADDLDTLFRELPGLVNDVATSALRQARVYRSAGRPRVPDEDWRGAQHALPPHPMPVDLDASDLLHHARNTLTTWARHLAETRGRPVVLNVGRATEGPVCAGHQHDYQPEGCGHEPERCKQYHPQHVHSMKPRGCGLDVDSETGATLCPGFHCTHRSCELIRHGEYTGTAAALVRWFLHQRDSIRLDEAAGQILDAITDLRDELARAVDRTPSPLYAGPCHAEVSEPVTVERGGTVYVHVEHGRCERDLYAWPGKDEIKCDGWRGDEQGCGTVHTPASRYEWLLAAVDDALLPLATWQAALPKLLPRLVWPNRSTWWRWVQSGRLTPRSIDRSAVELFRGGDAVDLVRAEQKRIVGNAGKSGRIAS